MGDYEIPMTCLTIAATFVSSGHGKMPKWLMIVFSLLLVVGFSFALSSVTFRRTLPAADGFFEQASIFFVALGFASLVSVMLPVWCKWIPYLFCMVPMLPFLPSTISRRWQRFFENWWSTREGTLPTHMTHAAPPQPSIECNRIAYMVPMLLSLPATISGRWQRFVGKWWSPGESDRHGTSSTVSTGCMG